MGGHDYPATCLSSKDHDIRDTHLHYFGCLRATEREAYLNALPEYEQERIKAETQRIKGLRALFEAEDDTKAIVQRLTTSLNNFFGRRTRRETTTQPSTKPTKENAFGMNAYAIFFRNSEPFDDERCLDRFPNQKLAAKDLIYSKDATVNPLVSPCAETDIRYFHIPGNNMEWVEEVIARHFNDERPKYDRPFHRTEEPSQAYMMLRPEYWRGQQLGARNDAFHARSMRPRCDTINTDPINLDDSSNNIVVFMPYLNWETEWRRKVSHRKMREITGIHRRKEANNSSTRTTRDRNHAFFRSAGSSQAVQTRTYPHGRPIGLEVLDAVPPVAEFLLTFDEVVSQKVKLELWGRPNSKFSRSRVARRLVEGVIAPPTILGQVLYRAALLSEAMACYQDDELLKAYLHHDPPLHPRRTLNQSFYRTLNTTEKRDRDQVVYRGTAPKGEFIHSGIDCRQGCEHCRRDIRKVPKVLMVDQLWLWILEDNTVITSFSDRYGRSERESCDKSDVLNSIGQRLEHSPRSEIKSAYDIALIIIDECSRVFFDPTKTPGWQPQGQPQALDLFTSAQPQVMDIFTSAISNVTDKQITAFDHFWDLAEMMSKVYRSKDVAGDVENKAKLLLDINPEGKLLREIRSILDELRMMLDIKNQQDDVLEQFQKQLKLRITRRTGSLTTSSSNAMGYPEQASNIGTLATGSEGINSDETTKSLLSAVGSTFAASVGLANRISDINNLAKDAERTEKALETLLALKQQEASGVQAFRAGQQSDETLRQGRSIMLFTVVTIIFLPLSFGTSIFGMNSAEFSGGLWSLKDELKLIFPISVGIICLAFFLAFSTLATSAAWALRDAVFFLVQLSWTKFITVTGLYGFWLDVKPDTGRLTKTRRKKVRRWKDEAKAKKQEQRRAKESKKMEQQKRKQTTPGRKPPRLVDSLPDNFV